MPIKFRINKDTIEVEAKKVFKRISLSISISCVALLVIYIVIASLYMNEAKAIMVGTLALTGFILIPTMVVAIIPAYLNYISEFKKMPKEISITENEIYIDNQIFKFDDIKQIRATPPTYGAQIYGKNKIHRMLIIIDKNNKQNTFFLGFRMVENLKFEDYGEICYLLKEYFIKTPEKFIYNL